MDDIFYEDISLGAVLCVGPYVIPEQELLDFAVAWDPLPIHVDKDYAAPYGGITAPGIYLLAIKMRLVHRLPFSRTVITGFGLDEVRFHRPVHPGDALTHELTWRDKRRSKSQPDRGIVSVRCALINAAGETVMSHLDTILMRLRNPERED
jgi:acyl dehydratase